MVDLLSSSGRAARRPAGVPGGGRIAGECGILGLEVGQRSAAPVQGGTPGRSGQSAVVEGRDGAIPAGRDRNRSVGDGQTTGGGRSSSSTRIRDGEHARAGASGALTPQPARSCGLSGAATDFAATGRTPVLTA
jgi:hypothetical protein